MLKTLYLTLGLSSLTLPVFSQGKNFQPRVGITNSLEAPATLFITATTPGSTRSDAQELGMEVLIGGVNVVITELGARKMTGNTGTRTVSLYSGASGAAYTLIDSVTINFATVSVGQYAYASFASPVTATAGGHYQVWRTEAGGQDYLDSDTTVTASSVASILSASYKSGGIIGASGGANNCFGTVNFKYTSP